MSRVVSPRGGSVWSSALFRGWGLPRSTVPRVAVERGIRMPVGEGVALVADRWIPLGVESPPLVVVRSPYGRSFLLGTHYGRFMAHQGFQVLIQSCRGTADSGGSFTDPFAQEWDDGAATFEWLRQQDWYPGSFSTLGASYVGYSQYGLAMAAGEELQAMVLQVAPLTIRDLVWPDDGLALGTNLLWATGVSRPNATPLKQFVRTRSDARRIARLGTDRSPLTSYRDIAGREIGFFENWLRNPDAKTALWERYDCRPALEKVSCPVLVQAGWYDLFLESGLEQYRILRSRGCPVELSIAPHTHGSFSLQGVGKVFTEVVDFLRRAIAGSEPRHRVRLVEIGTQNEVGLDDLPGDGGSRREFYLAGPEHLRSTPGASAHELTFRYDPADPTPAHGGSSLLAHAGPRDQASRENRSDVLTFSTDPFDNELHILGAPRVNISASSDRPAGALFLRLCTVTTNGRSTNVADRYVDLSAGLQDDEGRWAVRVAFPATSFRVEQGGRLRLQVSGGAFPDYARHPGTTESVASASTYEAAHLTLHLDGASILDVPVRI